MSQPSPYKTEEARKASWEAAKGGLVGAAKWGAGASLLGVAAYFWSPIYRKLTIQFKVYDLITLIPTLSFSIEAYRPPQPDTFKCQQWCWEE